MLFVKSFSGVGAIGVTGVMGSTVVGELDFLQYEKVVQNIKRIKNKEVKKANP